MSTNVTGGSAIGSGRGRFLGVLAAGLAVVIAAGVLFVSNQGNDSVVPNASSAEALRAQERQEWQEFLTDLRARKAAEQAPGVNPEAHQIAIEKAAKVRAIQDQRNQDRVEQSEAAWSAQSAAAREQRYQDMVEQMKGEWASGQLDNDKLVEERLLQDSLYERR